MNMTDQKSKAKVRLTLTGAQFSVLAFIINSDKSAQATGEFAQMAMKHTGNPESVLEILDTALAMRSTVLKALDTVKEAVVVNNQLEGIIDV